MRLATTLLATAIAAAAWSSSAFAQSIAYTVQVVALSDREAALSVQTELLRQGFPAYVVRSTSTQGDVFRVRVGAFANRPAALLYAQAMPPVSGGQPVPALAEGIPPGITPLAPTLVAQLPVTEGAVLFEWEDGMGVRSPTDDGPADYVLVTSAGVERHSAYLLAHQEGARLWVRETLLYPPSWRDETEAVNEGFRSTIVRLLAERLGVDPEVVDEAAFAPDADEAPRVIVVELEAPEQPDGVVLLGIGRPPAGDGVDSAGDTGVAGVGEFVGLPEGQELPPDPDGVDLDRLLATPPEVVEAEGFVAVADAAYTRLDTAGTTWRAVLGAPLWTDGTHLVTQVDGSIVVYGFVPR